MVFTELVEAMGKYSNLAMIPRARDIHSYINGLDARGVLFHMHSPQKAKSDMVGTYNLLFLVEYLGLIPGVVEQWSKARR